MHDNEYTPPPALHPSNSSPRLPSPPHLVGLLTYAVPRVHHEDLYAYSIDLARVHGLVRNAYFTCDVEFKGGEFRQFFIRERQIILFFIEAVDFSVV